MSLSLSRLCSSSLAWPKAWAWLALKVAMSSLVSSSLVVGSSSLLCLASLLLGFFVIWGCGLGGVLAGVLRGWWVALGAVRVVVTWGGVGGVLGSSFLDVLYKGTGDGGRSLVGCGWFWQCCCGDSHLWDGVDW